MRAISSGVERFLHTEEVAGSNPASPTILFSTTSAIFRPFKMKDVPKTAPKLGPGHLMSERTAYKTGD